MSALQPHKANPAAQGLSRWRGKVALVTGASSGIGAAIAGELGAIGMKVVLAGRDERRLKAVAKKINSHPRLPGRATIVACDQIQMSENRRLMRHMLDDFGGVDVLVNCAAMRGGFLLLESEWAEVQAALDLNIRATLWCAREAVLQMRGKREGAIINLSSTVGHRVLPGVPAMYAATKHALRILTDGLRSEVAAHKWPIKVAQISPGLTDTPWHRKKGGKRVRRKQYPHAPLTPGQVAEAVMYVLATPPEVQVRDIILSSIEQPY